MSSRIVLLSCNTDMYYSLLSGGCSHLLKVEEIKASTKLILRGLQPGTRYKVWVRIKPDGVAYDGYWSAWTEPVFRATPPSGKSCEIYCNGIIKYLSLLRLEKFLCLSFCNRHGSLNLVAGSVHCIDSLHTVCDCDSVPPQVSLQMSFKRLIQCCLYFGKIERNHELRCFALQVSSEESMA